MSEDRQDELIKQYTREILDEYFASRSPEPGNSVLGEPLTPEYKTTIEIADELAPILYVVPRDIVLYLKSHGYRLKTSADGSLRWEIWRDMRYIQ